ncbi:hypothetical protein [Mucilaginibacter sp.]|uniref:hypothetical protein n=1 Tax=Mucilaginibacter sp. TaxID=1882438 RepID=UPI003264BD97
MKYAFILLSLVGCFFISSCSKSGSAAPVPHNIKVTVTATAAFTVKLSATKADETVNSAIDTKTVSSGTYEFTTGLVVGGVLHLEIQNSGAENTVSYTITNNGAAGTSDSGKELGSFSKITTDYAVN